MGLIVQKFGGSSVADRECIFRVAERIAERYRAGDRVVAVVSAQGDTTDELLQKAREINEKPSKREMDVLLSTGEQITISLLAMALEKLGYPVISLTGWQLPVLTDRNNGKAKIKSVDSQRLLGELDQNKIVIAAGFQGINSNHDITTIGRGGSDTSAVALAAALSAEVCEIYTDVDGVHTADPRIVEHPVKLRDISYEEMLELASAGANVLHNRAVEMAQKYNVNLEVKSSFQHVTGTTVKEVSLLEKMVIRGVARDNEVARISTVGIPDEPGRAYKLFHLLAQKNIDVHIILQSIGQSGTKDISFVVSNENLEEALSILCANQAYIGAKEFQYREDVAKVSVVGAGMASNPGVASKIFEALYEEQININMVSTSEIKVSLIVAEEDSEKAVRAIHGKFF